MFEYLLREKYITNNSFTKFCDTSADTYTIWHMLMMASFSLRCHRIIECCKINYDERSEIKEFIDRRHLFKETHYIKILFAFMAVVIFVNLVFQLNFKGADLILIPYHFKICMNNPEQAQFYVSAFWVVINFIEEAILITYTYLIFINHIKQLIKFELFAFSMVWIIYPNVLRIGDFFTDSDGAYTDNDGHWTSWVCLGFLWICLVLNGYIPIILSFIKGSSLGYHFNPKLASNLYLFLSNESCFYSFYDFIKENETEKELFYFNLYTYMMKYRFKYTIEPDYYKVLDDAKYIYERFFSSSFSNMYLDVEITNGIKSNCQALGNDECYLDMFDDALVFVYVSLQQVYKNYKRSEGYQILIDNLNLNSYVQCKMCNTGLISKY